MKLRIHSQTSTVVPLKFGNGQVILLYTLLDMRLLIYAWIKVIREVLLHVKRECVRVTSDSGAQIRYTSRSRALLGFATRRDVSADKQAHRYQQMTRQQSIKHIRKQKWTETIGYNQRSFYRQFLLSSLTEMFT